MLQSLSAKPLRIVMTLDAVGGVWRYAMDLAGELAKSGTLVVFAGLGPAPSGDQRREAEQLGELVWLDAPLDWMVEREDELAPLPNQLAALVHDSGADLIHLNLPSQAYRLQVECPIVVVSHSCVVTWFHAVRQSTVPADWVWHEQRNRRGFEAADAVIAPSASHAAMLRGCYGPIRGLAVVPNASQPAKIICDKENFVFAAGRWWDEGKNGSVLDAAAPEIAWPVLMAGPVRGPNGQFAPIEHAGALGELPHREVCTLMARAGIFVSPSIYEPFGLAALEAAHAGAALVLSDIPTYRELWEGAALFAQADDLAAFAAAANRLIEDVYLRGEVAKLAGARAGRFSPQAQAQAMLDIYRSVCAVAEPELAAAGRL